LKKKDTEYITGKQG